MDWSRPLEPGPVKIDYGEVEAVRDQVEQLARKHWNDLIRMEPAAALLHAIAIGLRARD